ncbi:MAG: glycoside hydrolase family 28 protein [Pedobacter sp.]|nr:MAG: glycoside hydrolase family 28 protein [Pedobacter sp.]
MMNIKKQLQFLVVFSFFILSFSSDKGSIKLKSTVVEAPFKMPAIISPDFSACTSLSIVDFGALKGDKIKTTEAIAKAIAKANSIGGGKVVVPEGEWLTGKIHLKSNVNLHLNKGSTLLFSEDPNDYLPAVFIQFNRSENILIEGITITNSPFWTTHLYLSKNITVRNVKIYAHGHNNDGIDPEMSQNVLIENCTFDQGDDAIAIKSGRNPEGWRLKTPSKNIVIRNCMVKNGHQLVAIGSELSGGIENVFINNCKVVDGAKLDHLIFIKTNERMGGYVKNIYAKNITAGKIDLGILGIETDVLYQWRTLVPTVIKKLTPIEHIYLENINATKVKFVSRVLAQKELPVKNVRLTKVTADTISDKKHIHENLLKFGENL